MIRDGLKCSHPVFSALFFFMYVSQNTHIVMLVYLVGCPTKLVVSLAHPILPEILNFWMFIRRKFWSFLGLLYIKLEWISLIPLFREEKWARRELGWSRGSAGGGICWSLGWTTILSVCKISSFQLSWCVVKLSIFIASRFMYLFTEELGVMPLIFLCFTWW